MFDEVARRLQQPGAIGVIPTDTVYGVVARAADIEAVERLYALKKRDSKPGTIIAANVDQLVELGIKRRYLTAVEQFWPGAVSVIVPCVEPSLRYLHQGKMSLSVRVPDKGQLINMLSKSGPLLTTSANQPAKLPAKTIDDAKDYFGEQVDFYVDGGDLSERQPSTIIRIIDDAIEIVREGAVKIEPNEE